jgi:hypothetical protein
MERRCLTTVYAFPYKAYGECANILNYLTSVDGGIDNSDMRFLKALNESQNADLEAYMNQPEVWTDLHIKEGSEPWKKT